MKPALILCVPGPWEDRSAFLRRVVALEPQGSFMFAGAVLADVAGKDHIPLDLAPADARMIEAFQLAGQGLLSVPDLSAVKMHRSVAYLRFPLDVAGQRERIVRFTDALRRLGGAAIKVESAGIAHSWERWSALLGGSPFDLYCAFVVLVSDRDHYYSCGMHHFGLPECVISNSIAPEDAVDLMNRFNYWQIVERPVLASGHTFSITPEANRYRLSLEADMRHSPQEPFFNANGAWHLDVA